MIPQIEAPPGSAGAAAIDPARTGHPGTHLDDVPLRVEAVLDKVNISVKTLTSLKPGSVIRLKRTAGGDIDLYVARGAANEELGNEAAARADYRKALEIQPGNEDAQEGLSRLGGN